MCPAGLGLGGYRPQLWPHASPGLGEQRPGHHSPQRKLLWSSWGCLLRGRSGISTTIMQAGAREVEPTLTFFLRRRWTRAASCTVLSVSAWWAGASDTWAIMVVRQLAVARVSRSSAVSLCSLGVGGRGSEAEGLGGVLGDRCMWQLLQGWREGGGPLAGPGPCLGTPGSGLTPTSVPPGPGQQDPLPALR